jgi:hypothetical protein
MINISDIQSLALQLATDEGCHMVYPRHHHNAKVQLGIIPEFNEEVVVTKMVVDANTGERKHKHRIPDSKFTPQEVNEIRDYYWANRPTFRQLAKHFNCCLRTANQVILAKGAYKYLDSTYQAPKIKHCKYSKDEVATIREYAKANKGMSLKAVGAHFGCCSSTIKRIVSKKDIYAYL